MPRPSHYNRQFLIYLPTEKDLDNWKELAKAARISLNKYIFEMVERGLQEAQPRTDLIKEISDFREENQKQREEIKLKSLVLEKYETELFKFRHESFLQPKFQGMQQLACMSTEAPTPLWDRSFCWPHLSCLTQRFFV